MEKLFESAIKKDETPYHNIRKLGTGQREDYTTGCLLDYFLLKKTITGWYQ